MRALVIPLLLGLALPPADAADRPVDFATGMTLLTAAGQPFHRVELSLAVLAQTRPDLADIRIFNGAGEALPYAFASGEAPPPAATAPVSVPRFPLRAAGTGGSAGLDVKIEADGRLISLRSQTMTGLPAVAAWLFDLSALRQPAQALLLDWAAPADGFSTMVHVEGSDNLRDWRPLADAPLLDLRFGSQALQQKRIDFPATRYHYLRLAGITALPSLTASAVSTLPAQAVVPERWIELQGRPDERSGDYVFDLGARLVATRVELRLPEVNSVAPVEWQVRERQRDEWRSVARSTVWRLQRGDTDLHSPALTTGAVPGRYWRLRVDPRSGGLGAGAPVLRLAWTPTQLVFLARGNPPFTLAFGQRNARPAQLPLASLVPGYQPGLEASLPLAATGPALPLGGHNAPAPGQEDRPPPDWKRWLLWGVLLLGVGLLALMAHSLLRQPRPPA